MSVKIVGEYVDKICVPSIWKIVRVTVTLSAPWAKIVIFADGKDQDQTAQNVQSDLNLCRPVVKSDICGTIICRTLWILFTVVEIGLFLISGAERVNWIRKLLILFIFRLRNRLVVLEDNA